MSRKQSKKIEQFIEKTAQEMESSVGTEVKEPSCDSCECESGSCCSQPTDPQSLMAQLDPTSEARRRQFEEAEESLAELTKKQSTMDEGELRQAVADINKIARSILFAAKSLDDLFARFIAGDMMDLANIMGKMNQQTQLVALKQAVVYTLLEETGILNNEKFERIRGKIIADQVSQIRKPT